MFKLFHTVWERPSVVNYLRENGYPTIAGMVENAVNNTVHTSDPAVANVVRTAENVVKLRQASPALITTVDIVWKDGD